MKRIVTHLFAFIMLAVSMGSVADLSTEKRQFAVERIISGTSLVVRDVKEGSRQRIRLAMVNQPSVRYSPEAKPVETMAQLLRGHQVITAHVIYTDALGQHIALIELPSNRASTVNAEMVRKGALLFTSEFSDVPNIAPFYYQIKDASIEAKEAGAGTWSSPHAQLAARHSHNNIIEQ